MRIDSATGNQGVALTHRPSADPLSNFSRPVVAGLVAVLAAMLIAACGGASGDEQLTDDQQEVVETPTPSGSVDSVSWNVSGEPYSLDPIYAYDLVASPVVANMCEGLLKQTPDLKVEPWLGTTKQVSDTELVLDIREGVTFWDGSELTADDVVFSLERNQDPKAASFFSSFFTHVKSIEATGPLQVTMKFTRPDPLVSLGLAIPGGYIVSKRYYAANKDSFGTAGGSLMCTGPYKLDRWDSGKSVTMTANPDYWNEDLPPQAESFEFSFLADANSQINALLSGEIDGMYNPPVAGITRLESGPGTIYYGPSLNQTMLVAYATDGPYADPRVRQALSLALDREEIVDSQYRGLGTPAKTTTPDDYWTAAAIGYPPEVAEEAEAVYRDAYEALAEPAQDIPKAEQLLEEAGYDGEPIVLTYQVQDGQNPNIAQVIQQQAKEAGINIQLKSRTSNQILSAWSNHDLLEGQDLGLTSGFYGDVPEPLELFYSFSEGSGSLYNFTEFGSTPETREVGAAFDEAWQTQDPVERAENITALWPEIYEGSAFTSQTPLFSQPTVLFMNDEITGAPASSAYLYYPWAAQVGANAG